MCGIYGELSTRPDPASRDGFARTADAALAHRGPDGAASWSDAVCLLGHRRLAIIDLSERAAQPYVSRSGGCVVAYNGEIYNYIELRAAMAPPDGGWRSESDTEVLAERLERFGAAAVASVVGMFAFAAWFPGRRELLLVRDRLGKKPLYYTLQGGTLRFASEIGPLVAGGAPRRTSVDRIAEFLQHGWITAPRTGFVEVHAVPPGHLLRASCVDGEMRVEVRRYWELPPYEGGTDRGRWMEEFRATLEDAVRIRLRSDVPLGAFLSGGVDSSVVSLLARRSLPALRTFTVDFREQAYSEGAFAREVARTIGSEHAEIALGAADVPLSELVSTYGDLQGDPSAMPTIAVTREMRRHVTVALSGDGGDELLGGYARYALAMDRCRRAERVPAAVRERVQRAGDRVLPVWIRGVGRLTPFTADVNDQYARLMRNYPAEWPAALRASRRAHWPNAVAAALERERARPPLLRMTACDAQTYLPEDNLVKVDRASMAVGLEVRAPLLDHRLFELVSRARPEWLADSRGGKRPLRELFAASLPNAVFTRPKMGFGVPLGTWLHTHLLVDAECRLLPAGDPLTDVLDPREIRRLLWTYRTRLHRATGHIWRLLVLRAWFDHFRPVID